MIQTKDLRVDYDGVTAVHDLTLSIGPGEVFGLIGPNGAGKTSTIRVLATLQQPTYGDVRIAGFDIAQDPARVHALLAYMPDMPPVYEDLKCWEFLDLFAAAYFVDRASRRRRVDECIDQVKLNKKRDAMAGTLSRGMKQRLVLAKSLLHDPQVLLLDEPASGLDPIARMEMRDLLIELGERGKAVLVSSHILTELSEFCTSVGIMEQGHLRVSGRIEDILAKMRTGRRLVIESLANAESLANWLAERDGVSSAKVCASAVELDFTGTNADAADLLRALIAAGHTIFSFTERKAGVQDIMLEIDAREVS